MSTGKRADSQSPMDRTEIERQWRLNRRVIPAMQLAEVDHNFLPKQPGYGRTPYFYRKMALSFFRDARQFEWFKGQRQTNLNLAKHYFRSYREMTAGRGGVNHSHAWTGGPSPFPPLPPVQNL